MSYRPDVDGLRAVAIVLVVLFHAWPDVFPGGFVGVDVFFVISGYLISSIILGELQRGDFTFRSFYARRIRRIFPALVVVVTVTWLIGWYCLFPDEFVLLGKHVAGGNASIANLVLWAEAGYFDEASESKPLLHLWSLGIEEQFYIVWPMLLVLLFRSRSSFLLIVSLLAVVSLGSNLFSLKRHSAATAFYLPHNRVWELMIGGLLAYLAMHRLNLQAIPRRLAETMTVIGMALIVAPLWLYDQSMLFPGWLALPPTIGAALVIASPTAWVNRKLLSLRSMVYIGLVSYPLYLWHWPLLCYAGIVGWTGAQVTVLAVLLSVVLAVLTYECVEKAVKKRKTPRTVIVFAGFSMMLLALGLATFGGAPKPRNSSTAFARISEAVKDRGHSQGVEWINIHGVPAYVKRGADKIVLFYGDSHIAHYSPRIVKLIEEAPDRTKSAAFITRGGCPPMPKVYEDFHPRCDERRRERVLAYARSDRVDTVVVGMSWATLRQDVFNISDKYRYYVEVDGERKYSDLGEGLAALKPLEAMLAELAMKKKVFLVLPHPVGPGFNPREIAKKIRLRTDVSLENATGAFDPALEDMRLKLLALCERAGVEPIDPKPHFCSGGACAVVQDDGRPIYRDNGHLRASYVRDHIEYLDRTVREP